MLENKRIVLYKLLTNKAWLKKVKSDKKNTSNMNLSKNGSNGGPLPFLVRNKFYKTEKLS